MSGAQGKKAKTPRNAIEISQRMTGRKEAQNAQKRTPIGNRKRSDKVPTEYTEHTECGSMQSDVGQRACLIDQLRPRACRGRAPRKSARERVGPHAGLHSLLFNSERSSLRSAAPKIVSLGDQREG